jgi:hypothetical protein
MVGKQHNRRKTAAVADFSGDTVDNQLIGLLFPTIWLHILTDFHLYMPYLETG